MSNKKDYGRKFGNALSHVPITEYKDLLIQDKDNKLRKIDALDVKYEGSSFRLILDLYNDLKVKHSKLIDSVNDSISLITQTLIEKGYNTSNVELNALINDISKLLIIEPSKEYELLMYVDKYVSGSQELKGKIIYKDIKPDDYDKGYWEYIDNVGWVKDEEKYKEYWSVI